jgi:hypothetical protein
MPKDSAASFCHSAPQHATPIAHHGVQLLLGHAANHVLHHGHHARVVPHHLGGHGDLHRQTEWIAKKGSSVPQQDHTRLHGCKSSRLAVDIRDCNSGIVAVQPPVLGRSRAACRAAAALCVAAGPQAFEQAAPTAPLHFL